MRPPSCAVSDGRATDTARRRMATPISPMSNMASSRVAIQAHAVLVDLVAAVAAGPARRVRVAARAADLVAVDAVGARALVVARGARVDVAARGGAVEGGRAGQHPAGR